MRVIWVLAWRYFTGLHMDGKLRKTGRHGSVLPRYSGYFWNRYTRRRRAAWRNGVFWLLVASAYGLVFDRQDTIYAMLSACPFVLFLVTRAILGTLTQVVNYQDSDGVKEPYRVLRPKVRAWFRKRKPTKWRISLPDGGPVPPEIQRAILAENAEDHGEPILGMRAPTSLQMEARPVKEIKPKGRNPYRRKS